MRPFVEALRARLARPLPGLDAQLRLAPQPRPGWDPHVVPPGMRDAAGLVLLYPHEGTWRVPLTVRGSTLRHHTGQVSLPGGRVDPGETFVAAALREAFEEVGLAPSAVEVLGRLSPLHIPVSRHLLHPIVGVATGRPVLVPAPDEVDRVIEASIDRLRGPDAVAWDQRERSPGVLMDVPFFHVEDERVWGATAMVLAELIAVLAGIDGAIG
jgi:8-oxo-dGTP pyrophosphatase MutT (NUDIX family)